MEEGEQWSGWLSSETTQWSDLAESVTLDPGFVVYQTRQKCESLSCGFEEENVSFVLTPPEEVPFFSFTRYAQAFSPLGIPPNWLYTIFGYALGEQVVIARLSVASTVPTIECLSLPRPVSFPW